MEAALFYDPPAVFMHKGQAYPVLCAGLDASVSNNQAIILGVSGYVIRIVGWMASSNTATAGVYRLKSASAGTLIFPAIMSAPPSTAAPFLAPIVPSGYFETLSGQGLYTDVTVAAMSINVFYVLYKP